MKATIEKTTDEAYSEPIALEKQPKRRPPLRFPALPRFSDAAQKRAAGNLVKFLAILLVLTLIARGTSAATLAVVELSKPVRTEIVEKVSGSATVSVKDTLDVTVPEGLTVLEMFVGTGQSIKTGEILARFDTEEIAEHLTREIAELEQLLAEVKQLEHAEENDSSALENAKNNLQRAQEDYDATKAQGKSDIAAAQKALDEVWAEQADNPDAAALENAQRSLTRAQEDYDAAKAQGESDVAAAQDALNKALHQQADVSDTTALESAQRNLQRAQEDYNDAKTQGETDIASAQNALDEVLRKKTEASDTTALESAQRNLQRAQEDYGAIQVQGESDVLNASTAYHQAQSHAAALYDAWQRAADSEKDAVHQAYLAAQTETDMAWSALIGAQNKANENLLNAQRRMEDAEAAYAKALQDYDKASQQTVQTRQAEITKAQETLESAKKKKEESLLSAQRRVEDAEAAYDKTLQDYEKASKQTAETRQTEIDKAQEALESAKKKTEDNLRSAEQRVEDAETAYKKALQDYDKNTTQASDAWLSDIEKAQNALNTEKKKAGDNLLTAQRRVEDAQTAYEKSLQDYDKAAQQTGETAAQNSVKAGVLYLDIAEQTALVDDLRMLAAQDGMLRTDLEGIVSAALAEGTVTGQAPVVSFMDGAKGFDAKWRLSKTDADKLAVGDTCEVTTGGGGLYYNPTVTGTVSAIEPPDENDKSLVTIRLPKGDWSDGQRVDVQAVQGRDTYNLCVPLSALHSDNSGYFVLVMESKSTVLGIENVTVKTPVTVQAMDDGYAAVQGSLDQNTQVISAANKAVESGDRVRVSTK